MEKFVCSACISVTCTISIILKNNLSPKGCPFDEVEPRWMLEEKQPFYEDDDVDCSEVHKVCLECGSTKDVWEGELGCDECRGGD